MTEFVDSFNIYDVIVGINATNSIISLRRRWNGTSVGNTAFCQTGVGPRGNNALVLPQGAAIVKTFSHQGKYVIGMNVSMSSPSGIGGNPLIIFANAGRSLATLQVNLDGSILVYANGSPSTVVMTTGVVLASATYAYLEFSAVLSGTTNINVACEVQVNGVSLGTGNVNTGISNTSLISETTTFNQVFLTSPAASNGQAYIADLYLNNGSGATNTGFDGIVEIDAYPLPDADDPSFLNWTPLGGTGAHFSEINENPMDGLTSYVEAATVGAVDSYGWQDIPSFAGTVKAVQLTYCALTNAEGSRAFQGNVGAGGTEAQTPTFGLSSNFIYHHAPFDVDPATGVAWTRAGFNAKEFGLVLVA